MIWLKVLGLIPFPNHPCTLSASLAVRLYCRRFAFAFTNDVEMEWSVQGGVASVQRLQPEKAGAQRTLANFCLAGFTHGFNCQVQPQRNARQRVIAVEHDMFRVNFSDRINFVFGRVRR